MGENTNDETFILVTEHSAHFDHYDMKFKDNLFVNKECFQNVCNTRYDSIIWVSDKNEKPKCPKIISDDVVLFYDGNNPVVEDMHIQSTYIPIAPLSGLCKGLHYCGISLYLTKNGHGFVLPDNSPSLIQRALNSVQVCTSREVVIIDEIYLNYSIRDDDK